MSLPDDPNSNLDLISAPIQFRRTSVPHMVGRPKVQNGFYLVVTDLKMTYGMMSPVLRITNEHGRGRGAGLTVSQKPGEAFTVRPIGDDGARPTISNVASYAIPDDLSSVTSVTGQTGTVGYLSQPTPGVFLLIPVEGFATDFTLRGRLVCHECGCRHDLGTAMFAAKLCRCGSTLPTFDALLRNPPP